MSATIALESCCPARWSATERCGSLVLEDRYGRVSTAVTSQLPIAKWHEWIGDPSLADATLDRLVNNAYKVDPKGNCCAHA